MSKKRKARKPLIITMAVLGVLGVAAGATAIATKGFKQWGELERFIKGGVTVSTFEIESYEDGVAVFENENGDELTVQLEGSYEDKVLTLGDKTVAATTEEQLAEALDAIGLKAAEIDKVEDLVLDEDDLCKESHLTFPLNVEYDEDAADADAIELPYFNAVRINYHIPEKRVVVTANSDGDDKVVGAYQKRINKLTDVYENIDLFETSKNVTLSTNIIDMAVYSLEGAKDNTVEIKSIELIRTTKEHKDEKCWFVQPA